jgi:type VI protein secretion system component VasK
LWAFVNGALAPFVQKVGSDYVATSGQSSKITPSFLAFLTHASRLSQALYHGDPSGNPSLSFTMTALPAADVDHVSFSVNGATLAGSPKNSPSQRFSWPGTGQPNASLTASFGGATESSVINRTGLWAIWHVLERAEHGGDNSVQWTIRTAEEGPVTMNGHPESVKFSLDPQSAQILRPQFFGSLTCPGRAVQ